MKSADFSSIEIFLRCVVLLDGIKVNTFQLHNRSHFFLGMSSSLYLQNFITSNQYYTQCCNQQPKHHHQMLINSRKKSQTLTLFQTKNLATHFNNIIVYILMFWVFKLWVFSFGC